MNIPASVSMLTLTAIQAESIRAHIKHGEHSMLNPAMSNYERLAILMEEVGEVAHELTYDQPDSKERLEKELIQVGSVVASWLEAINATV